MCIKVVLYKDFKKASKVIFKTALEAASIQFPILYSAVAKTSNNGLILLLTKVLGPATNQIKTFLELILHTTMSLCRFLFGFLSSSGSQKINENI